MGTKTSSNDGPIKQPPRRSASDEELLERAEDFLRKAMFAPELERSRTLALSSLAASNLVIARNSGRQYEPGEEG